MGEAKRRRQAEQMMECEATDPDTGQTYQVRAAGITPRRLVEEWRRAITGESREVDVPCNGCQQCCWWPRVQVEPEEERPEDLARLALAQDELGWCLQKREDGACIHLGPAGCTVRAHRPRACRTFDCRIFGLVDTVQPIDEQGHCTPLWFFRLDDPEDRALLMAANIGGLPLIATMAKGGLLPSYKAVLRAIRDGIAEHLPRARQIVAGLLRLPAAELAKLNERAPQAREYMRRLALDARARRAAAE
jgi:Fe-S-cluster containining protein